MCLLTEILPSSFVFPSYRCILQSLTQAQQCPVCKTSLPVQSAMHPNYSLNDVVAKYRQHASAERELARHAPGIDELLKLADRLTPQGEPWHAWCSLGEC